MLQAIKVKIGGRGVPHGYAQMGKNDQNPTIRYSLLIERGFKGCQSLFFSIELKKVSLEQYVNHFTLWCHGQNFKWKKSLARPFRWIQNLAYDFYVRVRRPVESCDNEDWINVPVVARKLF